MESAIPDDNAAVASDDDLTDTQFTLKCISSSVGLGNVWRFPYVCYENGGTAFLIPYFLVLIFVSMPLYLLELHVGQFSATSGTDIWNLSPIFTGMFFVCTYIKIRIRK